MKNKLHDYIKTLLTFYADLLAHGFYHHGIYHL